MSFSSSARDLPTLNSYDAAHDFWDKIKPWRNSDDTNTRPLAARACHHKTIRKLADGSIACRLWSTDVVVYHPDGAITIDGYNSVTTNVFVNRVLPNRAHVSFTKPCGFVFQSWVDSDGSIAERLWRFDGRAMTILRENAGWRPVKGQSVPFEKKIVNRGRAKAALAATRYADYRAYRKMLLEMHGTPTRDYGYMSRQDVLTALADQTQWVQLISRGWTPDDIRALIYSQTDVHDTITFDHCGSWAEVDGCC